MHKQVNAKVNARVDQEMAPLIEALSMFSKLETIESCQGSDLQEPWVCFRYGEEGWRDLSKFVFEYLNPQLDQLVGDAMRISIRPSFNGAIADFSVRKDQLNSVVRAVEKISANLLIINGDKNE